MNIDILDAAASGMDAQRAALDVAARNVAAAEAAGPNADYARMIPIFRIATDRRRRARRVYRYAHRGWDETSTFSPR